MAKFEERSLTKTIITSLLLVIFLQTDTQNVHNKIEHHVKMVDDVIGHVK